MSKPIVITTDSTADLSQELKERYGIKTIPLIVNIGEDSYYDGIDIKPDELYKLYREKGLLPKTSAPSIDEMIDFFKEFTDQGCEVIHFDISSELSNSFNAASYAAGLTEGVYPIDSRMLSTGIALLAIEAAECRDKGMSAKEIVEHVEALMEKVSTSFVVDTLEFLWKGGRCSGVTAFGANLMKIKPQLELIDGKIEVTKKFRGKIERVYRKYIEEQLEGKKVRPGHVFITESGEIEPAVIEELMQLVKEKTGCSEVHHTEAGCTVCSHCGPKTLGVLFIEE